MIARRALARRAAGGKRAIGRASVSVAEYATLRRQVYLRGDGRCERPWCGNLMAEAHHIIKASHGGPDALWNMVGLCRDCHDWTDAPRTGRRGRLRITNVLRLSDEPQQPPTWWVDR